MCPIGYMRSCSEWFSGSNQHQDLVWLFRIMIKRFQIKISCPRCFGPEGIHFLFYLNQTGQSLVINMKHLEAFCRETSIAGSLTSFCQRLHLSLRIILITVPFAPAVFSPFAGSKKKPVCYGPIRPTNQLQFFFPL